MHKSHTVCMHASSPVHLINPPNHQFNLPPSDTRSLDAQAHMHTWSLTVSSLSHKKSSPFFYAIESLFFSHTRAPNWKLFFDCEDSCRPLLIEKDRSHLRATLFSLGTFSVYKHASTRVYPHNKSLLCWLRSWLSPGHFSSEGSNFTCEQLFWLWGDSRCTYIHRSSVMPLSKLLALPRIAIWMIQNNFKAIWASSPGSGNCSLWKLAKGSKSNFVWVLHCANIFLETNSFLPNHCSRSVLHPTIEQVE